MKKNLYKYLAGNEYPGRGIVLGRTPDGQKAIIAYWIMGRSANSRNRVFEAIPGGIRTVAADPAKLEDPHLIIYNAVLTLRETTIVTNGDQTDTIAHFMNENLFPGYSFEAALATRTYEDDAPNFTPRISGVVDMRSGAYKLSILKSCDGNAASVQRQTFDYPQPVAGEGHFISTYLKNGAPIPSYAGGTHAGHHRRERRRRICRQAVGVPSMRTTRSASLCGPSRWRPAITKIPF